MNKFLGFVIKEFYHIFRDFRTLLVLFGMPIAQILLFGYAITNEIKDVKIAILDKSKDVLTTEITNKILSTGYFVLFEDLNDYSNIEKAFRKGLIKEVIVFEPSFGENLIKNKKASLQIIADASDPNLATMMIGYTSSIINDYNKDIVEPNSIKSGINTEIKMRYNPEMKSVFMFVPGLMAVILLLVSALMTSISITREKELGTMEILLVSPLNPFQIIVGKVVPYMFLAFVNSALILLLAYSVFKVPVTGSLILLIAENLLFVITSLSLGIFISTVSNSQQVAMMISLTALMLPTIILSGYIFPIENMPLFLQLLSNIIPAKWFIRIVRGIMLKGNDFSFIWKETIILSGMTLLFILLSIVRFKRRLE